MVGKVVPASNSLAYVGKEPVKRTFVKNRPPTPQDNKAYDIGDAWINKVSKISYILVSKDNTLGATWTQTSAAGGNLNSINSVLPVTGNIDIINESGAGAIDVSAPGSSGAGTVGLGVSVDGSTISIVGNELVAAGAITGFPVDNGGPAAPSAGLLAILGPNATDFSGSGIETHTDITTNQIYLENRRFITSFVVDPSSTVGTRGEFTTITAALAALPGGNGHIYVKRGIYSESFTILGNVTLEGESDFESVIDGLTILTSGTITLKNIKFANSSAASSLVINGGITLRALNCVFSDSPGVDTVIQNAGTLVNYNNCQFNASTGNDYNQPGGAVQFEDCTFLSPLLMEECTHKGSLFSDMVSQTAATGRYYHCFWNNPTSGNEALSISGGAIAEVFNSSMNCTNSPAITGTGTLEHVSLGFQTGTGIAAGITQLTSYDWRPYGTTTTVGVNRYDPTTFTVDPLNGEVSLFGSPIFFSGTGQTIDGVTPVTIATISMVSDSVTTITGNISGRRISNGDGLNFRVLGGAKSVGAVVTEVGGSGSLMVTGNADISVTGTRVILTPSGTNVLVQVIGVAGATINWEIRGTTTVEV